MMFVRSALLGFVVVFAPALWAAQDPPVDIAKLPLDVEYNFPGFEDFLKEKYGAESPMVFHVYKRIKIEQVVKNLGVKKFNGRTDIKIRGHECAFLFKKDAPPIARHKIFEIVNAKFKLKKPADTKYMYIQIDLEERSRGAEGFLKTEGGMSFSYGCMVETSSFTQYDINQFMYGFGGHLLPVSRKITPDFIDFLTTRRASEMEAQGIKLANPNALVFKVVNPPVGGAIITQHLPPKFSCWFALPPDQIPVPAGRYFKVAALEGDNESFHRHTYGTVGDPYSFITIPLVEQTSMIGGGFFDKKDGLKMTFKCKGYEKYDFSRAELGYDYQRIMPALESYLAPVPAAVPSGFRQFQQR